MPKHRHAELFGIPKIIYLYNEGILGVNFQGLKQFIHKNFGNIEVSLLKLKEKAVRTSGLLFDFLGTQEEFESLRHSNKDACHIILTPKLFATLDEDKKLHIRASIYGFPSVISTAGIVEGPAKPKEYYVYKQKYAQLGIWNIEEDKIKRKFKARFIDYADKRMNEVLKGYIAQSLFFYITGEPFCKQKICRLFNAHWQEDLILSQIKSGRFCGRHKRLLDKIKRFNPLRKNPRVLDRG